MLYVILYKKKFFFKLHTVIFHLKLYFLLNQVVKIFQSLFYLVLKVEYTELLCAWYQRQWHLYIDQKL